MTVRLSKLKEMEDKREENQTLEIAQDVTSAEDVSSELNQPCWSVVTYQAVSASHLTYEEAVQWAEDLKKQGISGLCIITDDAAARVNGEKN